MADEKPEVILYLTVDWEGLSLDGENLEAIHDFRKRYPHIPMLHLLNPVYFLRDGVDAKAVTNKIRSTMLPIDGQGLHIHGWKSLADACNVTYKAAPSFGSLNEDCEHEECGYSVSLEYAYTEDELTRLVACSSRLLQQQGFAQPRHFRAGGWQLGPKLANALHANGFTFDSSSTDAALLRPRWDEQSGLFRMVKALHPNATPLSQPYELLPGLMHYPNNGNMVDYVSAEKLLGIFSELATKGHSVLVLGFHQETAFIYLDRLADAIRLMESEADATGVRLKWQTIHHQ